MYNKPDFIGVGVQKAGTTWLYKMLEAHPDIGMIFSDEKDTRFFTCFYDRGYAWYERHYEKITEKVKGEFSTSYFYSQDATDRIFNYLPGIKLIVSLRNPVDRIISNHRHQVQLGFASGKLEDIAAGIANNPTYIEQCMYYKHLSRWIQRFGKENVLVILFDDIKENPGQVCRNMYRFLGIDDNFLPVNFNVIQNPTRSHGINRVEKILKAVSRLLKSIGLSSFIAYIKRTNLKQKIQGLGVPSTSSNYEKADTRDHVLRHVLQDIEELERLIGRDLSLWKK